MGVTSRISIDTVDLLMEMWDADRNAELGLDPSDYSVSSKTKAYWLCDKEDHSWYASIKDVYVRSRCGVCRGLQVWPGFNDFASRCPDRVKYWHPKNDKSPQEVSHGTAKRYWFICEKGHEFTKRLTAVIDGSWCKYCAGKAVWQGDNDLATTDPDIAMEWDYSKELDATPETVSRGSNKKYPWVCSANPEHRWLAKPNDRTKTDGTGCPECSKSSNKMQKEFTDYVMELLPDTDVFTNHKAVCSGRRELDVYIPDKSIAFEFNGLYFHSDGPRGSKTPTKQKMDECADHGVDLYVIWEDDWRNRKDIVKLWVQNILGVSNQEKVGARKCSVVDVSSKDASEFLNKYHIQGTRSGSLRVGLEYDGSLVALAVFTSWNGGDNLRLDRYATSMAVVGGFSKIVSWVDKNVDYKTMETFADLTYSKGRLYESTGWSVDYVLNPDYSYLVNKTRQHKFKYRLSTFKNTKNPDGTPKYIYEEGMTEHELARANGLFRVYDAGKIKYIRTNPKYVI